MKRAPSLLILILLLGVPLFQTDQLIDIEWLVCENCVSIKTGDENTQATHLVSYYFEPEPPLFNQIGVIFHLKNPLSVLFSSFQRATPFWRPPPGI